MAVALGYRDWNGKTMDPESLKRLLSRPLQAIPPFLAHVERQAPTTAISACHHGLIWRLQ
jgi:hypothetical protein